MTKWLDNTESGGDPQELLRRAKAGDEESYGLLYKLYYTPIYRYLFFRTKDKTEAEDLAQGVFVKVFQALPNVEVVMKEPIAYFYTVARNMLIDHYRKQKVRQTVSEDDMEDVPDTHEDIAESLDITFTTDKVKETLKSLTAEQQEVIVLKFVNELSNKEIATTLGKNEDAVRQLQSRALKLLRQKLLYLRGSM